MFLRVFCYVILFIHFFMSTQLYAAETVSVTLQELSLPDAIYLLAKFLHQSVLISPNVHGVVKLNLQDATPEHAFNLLLTTQGLAKLTIGNVWFIAPQEELIKQKQGELKWQEISIETAPLLNRFWQLRYAKAEDVVHLLKEQQSLLISKRGSLHFDLRTNTIYIQDIAERIANLDGLFKRLDIPVKQILIEARLASVDSDFEQALGISFSVNNNDLNQEKMTLADAHHYSLAVLKLADGSRLDVKLAALENAGHAELISSPRLFTANQQPASIEAGEEVPYQEVSESGGTAVTFKKAVLGLKVTPQVLPKNNVLLQLQINQDRPSNKMVQGVPTISTRQIMTNVLVKSGQTIVLGGIYEVNEENGEERIPFLSKIPIVGKLFIQNNFRKNKRELLIFVTPKIITQTI